MKTSVVSFAEEVLPDALRMLGMLGKFDAEIVGNTVKLTPKK